MYVFNSDKRRRVEKVQYLPYHMKCCLLLAPYNRNDTYLPYLLFPPSLTGSASGDDAKLRAGGSGGLRPQPDQRPPLRLHTPAGQGPAAPTPRLPGYPPAGLPAQDTLEGRGCCSYRIAGDSPCFSDSNPRSFCTFWNRIYSRIPGS